MNTYDFYITPEEYATAKVNGVSRATLEARIRRYGWSKARAISEPCQSRTVRDGWHKVAAENGISQSTYYARILVQGWDPQRAATEPICEKTYELAAEIKRKIPRELVELALSNGIPFGTFRSRIYQSGWDMNRAATEPVWSHQQVCIRGNERYKEIYGDNPMGDLFPHRTRRAKS